jgi:hypothetical protein
MADDLVLSTGIDAETAMKRVMATTRGKDLLRQQVAYQNERQAKFYQRANTLYERSSETSERVHEYAMSMIAANPTMSYSDAVSETFAKRPDFLSEYNGAKKLAQEFNPNYAERCSIDQREHERRSQRPDAEIHRLATLHLEATGSRDYGAAVSHVMRNRPSLAKAYAEMTPVR